MQRTTLIASFFIALFPIWERAVAQNVYKCGNVYSESPCPGGVTVDVSDPRSSGQKNEADATTRRDARAADAMEKARLQEEAALLKARQPAAKPKSVKEPAAARPAAKTAKNKKPQDYFVAVVPGETPPKKPKKKPKAPRDSSAAR